METITSSLSSFSLSRQSSNAGNAITEFFSNFQTAIQTKFDFKKRNAVRYVNQAGHKFITILLTEPTCCSKCSKLIFGLWGFTCRSCNLICHKKCLQEIINRCVKDQLTATTITTETLITIESDDSQAPRSTNEQHLTHRFEPKTFMKPTICNHCGTILIGLWRQGLECSKCNMTVHFGCKQFVCLDCQSSSTSAGKTSSTSTLTQTQLEDDRHLQEQNDTTIAIRMSKIKIEDFEIIRLIGTGSFSKVYLAKLGHTNRDDSSLLNSCHIDEKEFAIKVIKKTNPVIGSDPGSVFSELRTLKLGRRYPFLAIAHCCFQSRDRLYLVMEHVVGIDFVNYLSRVRKFKEDQARFYAAEIALALMFLHNEQIVYRDLKLDNVILDQDGHCKLIDFGMSKELFRTSTKKTRTFCGTPSYISPEIILEKDYDYSVDWWSFGVLLYEMLIGHSPFDAYGEDEIYNLVLKETVKIPEYLSSEAKDILKGLLTKEPRDRLGCGCERHEAIKGHPFFMIKSADGSKRHRWHEFEAKQMCPPFRPTKNDLNHGHQRKGEEQVLAELSPVSSSQLRRISQQDYDGFSYYSESFRLQSCLNLN